MAFAVVDPADLLADGAFFEDSFIEQANAVDWSQYAGAKVLVRGCNSTVIPPWAYMYLTGKLAGVARSVRYGNEHDNIVVYRAPKDE
ncbi:DUF2480 family protein [candidate division GN15 bacterium]|nr:DUF2480 family protein [candidate division GN15 bacterium]